MGGDVALVAVTRLAVAAAEGDVELAVKGQGELTGVVVHVPEVLALGMVDPLSGPVQSGRLSR